MILTFRMAYYVLSTMLCVILRKFDKRATTILISTDKET